MTIIKRITKGSPLSHAELDGNFDSVPNIIHIAANLVRTADGTAGDATDVTMASFTVPGGLLKSNGALIAIVNMAGVASSQDKILSLWVGGQTLASPPITSANTRGSALLMANMAGAGTLESCNQGLNPFAQSTGAIISRSIDMTVDQPGLLTLRWAAAVTAGNTWRIMSATILAIPGTV